MIYLGFFSFTAEGKQPESGHFTCVVDAESTEAAFKSLHKLVQSSIRTAQLFSVGTAIYLDSLVEVAGRLPKNGVVAHYHSQSAPAEPQLFGSLVFPKARTGCVSYSTHDPEDEEGTVEPFVTVDATDADQSLQPVAP
jgi:hypothetical protein